MPLLAGPTEEINLQHFRRLDSNLLISLVDQELPWTVSWGAGAGTLQSDSHNLLRDRILTFGVPLWIPPRNIEALSDLRDPPTPPTDQIVGWTFAFSLNRFVGS